MRGIAHILFLTLAALAWSSARAQAPLEYAVKAAYLYKLAPFVKWPDGDGGAKERFLICIGGNDPFGDLIDDVVQNQTVGGAPIEIVRVRRVLTDSQCDVLYAGGSARQNIAEMLAQMAGRPVLTVTDENAGSTRGIVHFVQRGNNIRFMIDLEQARRNRLTVSSKLLSLAVAVTGDDDESP